MPTDIKLKNSVTATNAPTSLQQGEVAINITDKKVWVGNAATTPVLLLGSGADGTFTNLTVSGVATFSAGTVSAPAITTTGDTNTGIFFPAADTIAFTEGGVESMRIDSSGNVGIGTASPSYKLSIAGNSATSSNLLLTHNTDTTGAYSRIRFQFAEGNASIASEIRSIQLGAGVNGTSLAFLTDNTSGSLTERMRIDSSGNVLVGTTVYNDNAKGILVSNNGRLYAIASADGPLILNRLTNDGTLVDFKQDNTIEGNISVSGTTVSYNGGHLSRWSQLPDGFKDDAILKGTVMSNLDDMCVWEKDGVVAENEQLNKMKVSDVEGDTNVAGVFVNWTVDADYGVDDMNVAMTGDMIIRIADGVVVQKGDLLMSAGNGTAKPQGDDIVRSKTIAKVTSNYVTCTYADGSYCVPCVLMAC